MNRKIQLQMQATENTLALTEQESNIDYIFKVKNGILRSSYPEVL